MIVQYLVNFFMLWFKLTDIRTSQGISYLASTHARESNWEARFNSSLTYLLGDATGAKNCTCIAYSRFLAKSCWQTLYGNPLSQFPCCRISKYQPNHFTEEISFQCFVNSSLYIRARGAWDLDLVLLYLVDNCSNRHTLLRNGIIVHLAAIFVDDHFVHRLQCLGNLCVIIILPLLDLLWDTCASAFKRTLYHCSQNWL